MGRFKIWAILLFIAVVLLAGCTRKYECCVGYIDGETGEFIGLSGGEPCNMSITESGFFTQEDAEEQCAEIAVGGASGEREYVCECERAN